MSAVAAGAPQLIALVGIPNCGKTALFNRLTGSRQKVANYAGVTVERKEGVASRRPADALRVLDLPGAYSLDAATLDEAITRDVLLGRRDGEPPPDARRLRRRRDQPAAQPAARARAQAARRADGARAQHERSRAPSAAFDVDKDALAASSACRSSRLSPCKPGGVTALLSRLDAVWPVAAAQAAAPSRQRRRRARSQRRCAASSRQSVAKRARSRRSSDRVDRIVLHPVLGLLMLAVDDVPDVPGGVQLGRGADGRDQCRRATRSAPGSAAHLLPDGALRSLLVDGVLAGVGSVLVFLPQILILFLFILVLEDSGYLPRAAFLLDRLMGSVGLSGRAFIPLLSSFACAIPGIMATRTIPNPRDRLATIMIAPLMTCSARLPVYALVIAAFIPQRSVGQSSSCRAWCCSRCMSRASLGAMAVAFVLKRTARCARAIQPLMLELPEYHWPHLRNLSIGLWERVQIFLTRVGTIILSLMIAAVVRWLVPGAAAGCDRARDPVQLRRQDRRAGSQ